MNVLISGTSSGIGLATARRFLQAGHRVYGLDMQGAAIEAPRYQHFTCDVSNAATLPELPEGADVVICNAGTANEKKAISVNLQGCINVAEKYAFQPNIKCALIVGSLAARSGLDTPQYAASQGGKIAYMKNLAMRLGKLYKARVNSISFGAVVTNLEPEIYANKKFMDAVANENILKKWTAPCEAAEWLYFVATTDKSMTGQDILIDNGEEANYNWIHV